MRLLPDPLWTPNGWFPLTDTEAWFDDLLAADLGGGPVTGVASATIALTATALGDVIPPSYATITYEGISAVAENAAGATTLAITWPTVAAGDVAVLFVGVSSSTLPTNPGTFTSQVTSTSGGSSPSFRVSTRVCDGSETGTLNVTTPNVVSRGYIVVFRNVDNTTPLEAVGTPFASSTSTTAYDLPSVTTGMAGCALLDMVIGNAATGSFTPASVPAAFTEITDDNSPLPHGEAAYHIWAGSGATGDGDVVRSAGTRGCGVRIALRPAATGGAVTGVADSTLSVTATAAGYPTTLGAASATLALTATAAGIDRALGVAASTITLTATASGTSAAPPVTGVATATLSVTATAAGYPTTLGAASSTITLTATASGTTATPPVTGVAASTITVTAAAAGKPTTFGTAAATIGVTSTAAGVDRALGAASASVGVTATAVGTRRVRGAAASTVTVTASALGAVAVQLQPAPASRTLELAPEARILALAVEAPRVMALAPESRVYQLAVDPPRVTALPPESRLHALETP